MSIPGLDCAREYPLLGFGASSFAVLIVLCAVPRFRCWLGTRLEMPLPSTRQHLLPLDAFRGIAAMWVALFHAWQWTMPVFRQTSEILPIISVGHYGVQIFVVLSGMLIFRSLRSLRDLDHLRAYFWRRLLRICPLYVAVSAVFLVLYPPGLSASISEIFMLRSLGYPAFMNPPAWSVYVEVLFYLVMPAFVLLAARRPSLAAGTIVILLTLGDRSGVRELALWKFFFLGVLCSEAIERAMTWRSGFARALPFFLGTGLVSLAVVSSLRPGLLGYNERELTVGIGVALMLLGTVATPWLRAAFSIRPLRILGTISYSIYLIHPLILVPSFGLKFSHTTSEILTRGYAPVQLPAADLFLVYVPALVFFSCCTFLAIERPMLRLRPTSESPTLLKTS
ncbi:MAG: acyltransferase [Humidesulfovibrio sp.]|uniref:acyltransferase family protein n=1 Tax=Humidesulfovibrio sp. TaxID=2910988 RepID=UPI0027369E4A|nr:acyltransferase [Humidesulfovibrio sp.]MDP2848483.1 acyltransferase [Humidesulfovibrio sp.]